MTIGLRNGRMHSDRLIRHEQRMKCQSSIALNGCYYSFSIEFESEIINQICVESVMVHRKRMTLKLILETESMYFSPGHLIDRMKDGFYSEERRRVCSSTVSQIVVDHHWSDSGRLYN
jgi:hypothetical protein